MPPNPRNADGRRVVRVGGLRADPHVRHAVGAARVHGRVQQHQRGQVRVGAGVRHDLDVVGEQRAVGVGGGAVAHHVAVALRAGQQRLVAGPQHPHRLARAVHRDREVRLDRHVLLAAEAAADVGRDHAHLRIGHAEDPARRRGSARSPGSRRGGSARRRRRATRRRPRARGRRGRRTACGRSPRRRPRLRRTPPSTSPRSMCHSASRLPPSCTDRCVLGKRRLRVAHDRQVLVLDLDQLAGDRERVLGLGDHERDRLAVEAHTVGGEHLHARLERADGDRLTGHVDADLVVGHVLAEEHGHDARHRGRGRRRRGA